MEFAYGKGLPAVERNGGLIPVYGSTGVVGFHDTALVSDPTVIVGRKGNAGAVYLTDGPSFPIDTVFYVVPKSDVLIDMGFVSWALKHADLARLDNGTAVPSLTRKAAYLSRIPFPPIAQQRRIGDLARNVARQVKVHRKIIESYQAMADLVARKLLNS